MTARFLLTAGVVAMTIGLVGCERPVSYAADVQPILAPACGPCHNRTGEGLRSSGFSVATYDDIMKGMTLGPVIIPGSSESSNLYRVIAAMTAPEIRMPPSHPDSLAEGRGQPLSEEQIGIIKRWIDEGAKDN